MNRYSLSEEYMNKKLPAPIVEYIKQHHITIDDLLSYSETDMTKDCEYADGYVLLTKHQLIILSSLPDITLVRLFKGYHQQSKTMMQKDTDWTIHTYEVSEIEQLFVDRQVACGILILKTAQEEINVAAFTNLYIKKVFTLLHAFEHREDDSPIEESTQDEDEDYCPTCGFMYPDSNRKICPRCMNRKTIFIRVLNYFKPYRVKLSILFLCYLATALLNMVWPYLNGTILYDKVLKKSEDILSMFGIQDGRFVTVLLLVVLTMFMTKVILQFLHILQGVFTAQIVANVIRDLKMDVFHSMGKLSISFYKSRQTGSLMTRVLSDADRVTGFFIDGAPYIFIHGLTIIVTIIVMLTIQWKLALVACVLMPISVIIGYKLRPRLWSLFGKRHRAERSVNNQVNDNLTGARVVKAFGQEERELNRFKKSNKTMQNAELSIVKFNNKFRALYNFVQELTSIVVWILGITMIFHGTNIQLGVLITFIGYVGQLAGPMDFLSHIFHWWADSMNSAQRIFEIIDAIPDITEKEQPISFSTIKGDIRLKDVTFGYEANKPILKNINLHIKPGEMLGIVGRSGAGKTTLVNLISRMYDPQEGAIYLDGINIKDLSFDYLRKNVAMVSQETYIFMGTIEENIAYANPTASKAEIIQAAVLASAHDFICRMQDGYDTIVGSSGQELSGGERQRISIARAILANPKILILDEATASVDTETEKAIQRSINYLIQGRTTISIAHRLSTLRDANHLVVIDNGLITEEGTQKELYNLQGTYYKLMELQTKALALRGLE